MVFVAPVLEHQRVGRTTSVLVIDLAARVPHSSSYFYDFFHFTVSGSERVADLVCRELCPFLARRFPSYVVESCAAS